MNGLTSLSESAAEHLGNHYGRLSLNSVSSLSDQAAKKIIQNIELDGLTALSPSLAAILAGGRKMKGNRGCPQGASGHVGGLSLGGIFELSDEAAKELGNFKGSSN